MRASAMPPDQPQPAESRYADLRVRVRKLWEPLRGARRRRGGGRPVPGLSVSQGPASDLRFRAAEPAAAGTAGALGRIAATRARGGARRADRRGATEAGGRMSAADAAERRERLVELYREVAACTRCPLHQTRTKAVFGAGDAD